MTVQVLHQTPLKIGLFNALLHGVRRTYTCGHFCHSSEYHCIIRGEFSTPSGRYPRNVPTVSLLATHTAPAALSGGLLAYFGMGAL